MPINWPHVLRRTLTSTARTLCHGFESHSRYEIVLHCVVLYRWRNRDGSIPCPKSPTKFVRISRFIFNFESEHVLRPHLEALKKRNFIKYIYVILDGCGRPCWATNGLGSQVWIQYRTCMHAHNISMVCSVF